MPSQTYSFVQIVTAELYGRVRNNADAIGAVAGHEASPALFLPHLCQALADGELVLIMPGALHLEENLQSFEGGNDGS